MFKSTSINQLKMVNWGEIMNKNTIIIILVVLLIAAGAALIFGQSLTGKTETQINFLNKDDTFQNGEQVVFELKDSNGNAIGGETVNLTYNNNETYSVVTDSNGKGYFIITGEESGKYDLEAKYAGNGKYDACTAKVTLTITDDTADNPVTVNVSSATTSTSKYNKNGTDSHEGCRYLGQYEVWVRNSDDIIVDAMNDVMSQYIGMNFYHWYEFYGPGSLHDNPDPIRNNTTQNT